MGVRFQPRSTKTPKHSVTMRVRYGVGWRRKADSHGPGGRAPFLPFGVYLTSRRAAAWDPGSGMGSGSANSGSKSMPTVARSPLSKHHHSTIDVTPMVMVPDTPVLGIAIDPEARFAFPVSEQVVLCQAITLPFSMGSRPRQVWLLRPQPSGALGLCQWGVGGASKTSQPKRQGASSEPCGGVTEAGAHHPGGELREPQGRSQAVYKTAATLAFQRHS